MDMIKKLMCATDGSAASAKAVEFACNLANQLGIGVTFLTVDPVTQANLANAPRSFDSTIISAINEQEQKELHAAEKTAREKSVKEVTAVVAHGHNIAATIINYAEENGFDHILVGSTGRTGISRMLLGSIASDVVAKAHCPVTVVR
jgi:nucleotide-binding universal stress UspA family protein